MERPPTTDHAGLRDFFDDLSDRARRVRVDPEVNAERAIIILSSVVQELIDAYLDTWAHDRIAFDVLDQRVSTP